MRKVFLTLPVNLVLNIDEGVDVSTLIEENLFVGLKTSAPADLEDVTLGSVEITDSK